MQLRFSELEDMLREDEALANVKRYWFFYPVMDGDRFCGIAIKAEDKSFSVTFKWCWYELLSIPFWKEYGPEDWKEGEEYFIRGKSHNVFKGTLPLFWLDDENELSMLYDLVAVDDERGLAPVHLKGEVGRYEVDGLEEIAKEGDPPLEIVTTPKAHDLIYKDYSSTILNFDRVLANKFFTIEITHCLQSDEYREELPKNLYAKKIFLVNGFFGCKVAGIISRVAVESTTTTIEALLLGYSNTSGEEIVNDWQVNVYAWKLLEDI